MAQQDPGITLFLLQSMATAYVNLVKNLKLAIQQLEQSTKVESSVDEDQLIDLADQSRH